jgi:hypothetical protein
VKIKAPEGPIEPNASGKINVSIMTNNLRGHYHKDIEIVTNDPTQKDILFTIQANILETLVIMPAYVNFGQVKAGEKAVIEISLSNSGSEPLTVKQITTTPDTLSINPLQKLSLKPGEKKQLVLTLLPGKSPGIIEGTVKFKTDLDRLPEKIIYVRAEVLVSKEH